MPSVIARFNEAVRTKNAALTADLFAEDVRLYGVLWKPFEGKAAAFAVFAMLQQIIGSDHGPILDSFDVGHQSNIGGRVCGGREGAN